MTQDIVVFENVSKSFGAIQALHDISFAMRKGRVMVLLGPNGAGKSTALSLLMGMRRPDAGRVRLFDLPPGSGSVLRKLGLTPQETDFPPELTPRELLRFATAHYRTPEDVEKLVERFGLTAFADRRTAGFSGGQKRRLALAMAFAGRPQLVLLDEPTTGLDPEARKGFHTIIRDHVAEQGGTVLLTSHDWEEISRLADHIVMMDAGRVVVDGSVDEIRKAVGLARMSLACTREEAILPPVFRKRDGYWEYVGADTDAMLHRLLVDRVPFRDLRITPLGLEEALDIYRRTDRTDPTEAS